MNALRSIRPRVSRLVAVALVGIALTACTVEETDPGIKSCSPSYQAPSNQGNFSAQQYSRGSALQWGMYPDLAYQGDWYVIDLWYGSEYKPKPSQNYAPHGSVAASATSRHSGEIFKIDMKVYRAGRFIRGYILQCKFA